MGKKVKSNSSSAENKLAPSVVKKLRIVVNELIGDYYATDFIHEVDLDCIFIL
jgi:hypothetical protein